MAGQENSVHLHDRATRGLPLSETERKLLEAWYAQQDAEESALLTSSPQTTSELPKQINMALRQVQTVTQHIQALTTENETLRQEIVLLYHQLSQTKKAQTV
jgi:predicted RNase H-like nuclease (RuvC/YqgF family)